MQFTTVLKLTLDLTLTSIPVTIAPKLCIALTLLLSTVVNLST